MNYVKASGFGFLLFAIMFVLGSVVMFGLKFAGASMSVILLLLGLLVLWILSKMYGVSSQAEGLKVGLVWLVVDALLEYLVIVQIFNKGDLSFYTPLLILGYATIIIVPVLYGKLNQKN